ncbi:MAG: hypothetical protein II319_08490 [Clostridia bacterium]|nr:hypothetical protein [Clostridia bacterium]
MKRILIMILSLAVCLPILSGCSQQNLDENSIKRISVTSLPEGYEYSFKGDDAQAIVDYLESLHLTPFSGINSEDGMTWVISIEDKNGKITTVYHSCNKYIMAEGGLRYEMIFEEANRFSSLLYELDN